MVNNSPWYLSWNLISFLSFFENVLFGEKKMTILALWFEYFHILFFSFFLSKHSEYWMFSPLNKLFFYKICLRIVVKKNLSHEKYQNYNYYSEVTAYNSFSMVREKKNGFLDKYPANEYTNKYLYHFIFRISPTNKVFSILQKSQYDLFFIIDVNV